MADIFHLFNIKIDDPLTVYKALTEEGLSSWWTTGAKAKLEEEILVS